MEGTGVLLLFDKEHPCWNARLVELAGEEPRDLALLAEGGCLVERGEGFILTEKGREAFRKLAKESFFEASPGGEPDDVARALDRNRLEFLLDRAFLGRWGQKEMRSRARLPLFPDLSGEALLDRQSWEWTYPDQPGFRSFDAAFPDYRAAAPPPPMERFDAWKRENGLEEGELEADLLLIHRYDFEIYMKYPAQPNDRMGFLNSDRFLFRLVYGDPSGRMREMVEEVGRAHLSLLLQRRVLLPWYFDVDNEEQDSVLWWFWVTETEREAREIVGLFEPLGSMLIDRARPFEVWALSMEALQDLDARRETLWDLMEEIGNPVARCTGLAGKGTEPGA